VTKTEERFAVKLEQLINNVTFKQRGVSFVRHSDNSLKDKLEWMLT
jgi:DNA phosphorothioation-dependent restriction protein DptG